MKKEVINIIKLLIENDDYISEKNIATKLKISLYNTKQYLFDIDNFLLLNKLPLLLKIPHCGIKLQSEYKHKILNLLNDINCIYIDIYNSRHRQLILIWYIFNNYEVAEYINQTKISKRTFYNDLKLLKYDLNYFGIQVFRNKYYYFFQGDIFTLRNVIISKIFKTIKIENLLELSHFYKELSAIIQKQGNIKIDKNFIHLLNNFLPTSFDINVSKQIVVYVFLVLVQYSNCTNIKYAYQVNKNPLLEMGLLQLIKNFYKKLEALYKISITDNESYMLYMFLNSFFKIQQKDLNKLYPLELEILVINFIKQVSEIEKVDFSSDIELHKNILYHLFPLYFRIKFNQQKTNL